MFDVEIDKKAAKELQKFPKFEQKKIIEKIVSLKQDPRPIGYELLKGHLSNYYRIRFGDYRIVYEIIDKQLLIFIVKIAKRSDVYKQK